MAKIRVLVVDDSVVVRRLVTDALSRDPMIEIAGVAANGRIALAKIAEVSPDIVTLDVEMPEMDGLATLVEIRKTRPKLPVIMFSTLTERGGVTTLEALARGASDYVTKPSNVGSVNEALERLRAEMLPKIKALCGRSADAPPGMARPALGRAAAPGAPPAAPGAAPSRIAPRPSAAPPPPRIRSGPPARVEVVAIGVSTGGPNALAVVISRLPGDLPVPILIVQHMPPLFTKLLAERLDSGSRLTVREAFDGARPTPGSVWVAPGDHHMLVAREGGAVALRLNQAPAENSCRPAVDPLFRSVVEVYGAHALGVVLTGMGRDGLLGARALVAAGSRVIAQDEASSVVWGMPGYVASEGLAERVLPIGDVPGEIERRVTESRGLRPARAIA